MSRNLVLVGFMGAGKSTAGRLAAYHLKRAFVDSDSVIEARAGKRISDIFADEGEAAFRSLERETVLDLAKEPEIVIATGGGAFIDPDVRASLKDLTVTAYLKAPFSDLWERIALGKDRPLLEVRDAQESMRRLFESRVPCYEEAHVVVDATQPVAQVAGELVRRYNEWTKRYERAK